MVVDNCPKLSLLKLTAAVWQWGHTNASGAVEVEARVTGAEVRPVGGICPVGCPIHRPLGGIADAMPTGVDWAARVCKGMAKYTFVRVL